MGQDNMDELSRRLAIKTFSWRALERYDFEGEELAAECQRMQETLIAGEDYDWDALKGRSGRALTRRSIKSALPEWSEAEVEQLLDEFQFPPD